MSRALRIRCLSLLHDGLVAGVAFLAGFVLRLGDEAFPYLHNSNILWATVLFMVLTVVISSFFDLSRGVWRYTSVPDVLAIGKIATLAVMLFAMIMFFVVRLHDIPRTSLVITWCLLILMMGGSRLAYRLWRSRRARLHSPALGREKVILVGAGNETETFIRATVERGDMPYTVCGVFDERGRRSGLKIRGVPVMGTLEDLEQLLDEYRVPGDQISALILTTQVAKVPLELMDRLMDLSTIHGFELRRLPQVNNPTGDRIRRMIPQQISIEDLLQRASVSLNFDELRAMLQHRVVLITGAGGSIGSQLCREIASCKPSKLVMLDSSEYMLYSIEEEICRKWPELTAVARLCDVRDRDAVNRCFDDIRPEYVFHAAALKHLTMVERQPLEGLHTNVLGSRNVADATASTGARAMVLVSTDKAVNPTNIMGATKRAAELYCQALDTTSSTRFVSVRFGNVLGSTGSVVPLFKRQIEAGGPVTVTHPEITRYFMTIPEATQLVLHAMQLALTKAHSRGHIYVLDMGEPVKIVDLARRMIVLSGMKPNDDIQIVYTGLRLGEKLYEELFSTREQLAGTEAKSVFIASPAAMSRQQLDTFMAAAERIVSDGSSDQCISLLKELVPEARISLHKETRQALGPGVIPLPSKSRGI